MKKLALLLAMGLFTIVSYSQPCLPDGIQFVRQTQIDSFQIKYPNCTKIEGGVFINGEDISSLSSLSVLTSIGGYLSVIQNPILKNISGLDSLTSIGGYLSINHNESLKNLSGLNSLISIGQYLDITGNWNLTSISVLSNLKSVGGRVEINSNNYLNSLIGLEGLTEINGNLAISGTYFLTNLYGLNNIYSINGSLEILGNSTLENLNDIQSLTSLNGKILLIGNDKLTDITGLKNINADSLMGLHIYTNDSLRNCHIQSICDYLITENSIVQIYDNATGCNSQEEVEEACGSSIFEFHSFTKINLTPNPFTTSTTIEYTLNSPQTVIISFYDSYGRAVDIITQHQQQGLQKVIWTPEELNEGIYYFRVETGGQVTTGKVVYMK